MMLSMIMLAAFDLGTFFSAKAAWTEKAELFAVDHAREGFVFASENRDIVNCLNHDSCVWHGLKVWETKVYFDKSTDEEHIERVELSLYNRGDAGDETIDEKTLKGLIATVANRLAPNEKNAKPEMTRNSGGYRFRQVFEKADPAAELVWGLSGEGGRNSRTVDYLRLTLTPSGTATAKQASRAKRIVGKAGVVKFKENVTKSPNGDVFIDGVPMVDQGRKGYCSAAVSERVLRYYGNRIDEHEIAQQAGTTAEGGTSVAALKEAVTAIGKQNGLGYQDVLPPHGGIGGLEEEVARYNKAAKAAKESPISLDDFTHGNMISVGEMRAAMKPKVLYAMRRKDPDYKKMSTNVRQQINAGVPVFWGVTLGIFPERGVNPQTSGGHMRLIIGYNDKKKELLYTDTWGEGHELKRMPEDWALTITDTAFILKPR